VQRPCDPDRQGHTDGHVTEVNQGNIHFYTLTFLF
jgi:hypothetical protein